MSNASQHRKVASTVSQQTALVVPVSVAPAQRRMRAADLPRKVAMVHLDWTVLEGGAADALDGRDVQMAGWWTPGAPGMPRNYGLLLASPGCCGRGHAASSLAGP